MTRECPLCSGTAIELGTLGSLTWYRCIDCGGMSGWEVTEPATDDE